MKIVKPSSEIIHPAPFDREAAVAMLKTIEAAGRTCYKSEALITEDSAQKFIAAITKRGHHSVIEHGNLSVRTICDRGVTHELVRHRLCAFSQESTRYCNYGKDQFGNEITVIEPPGLSEFQRGMWANAMSQAEMHYFDMLNKGCSPQIARSVLPNSLKTEIVTTANLREWRHILGIRVQNKAAHPQIRQALLPVLQQVREVMPEVFGDIEITDGIPE